MDESAVVRQFGLDLTDGRRLAGWAEGDPDAFPLLFVTGTPSSGRHPRAVAEAALARGWQVVSFARPGYGASTQQGGRIVADYAADAAAVLDHLGRERFVVAGWSGGGPHALACAALLPERCLATAVLAGVAPYPAPGLDWMAGMGEENVAEFGAALEGPEALTAWLDPFAAVLASVTGADVASAMGDLISAADAAALAGGFADELAESYRDALSTGIAGLRDDDLAFTRPWGFELAEIAVPVTVWQGAQDRMVPAGHGPWIAEHIPGARLVELPDAGHITLIVEHSSDVVADLAGHVAG